MNQEVQLKDNNTLTNQKGHAETQQADLKPSVASLPLPPFDPNNPIGQFPHTNITLGILVRMLNLYQQH